MNQRISFQTVHNSLCSEFHLSFYIKIRVSERFKLSSFFPNMLVIMECSCLSSQILNFPYREKFFHTLLQPGKLRLAKSIDILHANPHICSLTFYFVLSLHSIQSAVPSWTAYGLGHAGTASLTARGEYGL